MTSSEVWIGLVEVKPLPDNETLGRAKGAFVNVVAMVSSAKDYLRLVNDVMEEYRFAVIACRDVARLDDWSKTNVLHDNIRELAASLTIEFPIQFDDFQSYRHETDG